jgi:hypothetical protein
VAQAPAFGYFWHMTVTSRRREIKLNVINYIINPQSWVIDYRTNPPLCEGLPMMSNWRPLTDREVEKKWGIPARTINDWWRKRWAILQSSRGSRRCTGGGNKCYWPALEEKLNEEFVARRASNQLVSRGWFRRNSRHLFKSIYLVNFEFAFTYGWFSGF